MAENFKAPNGFVANGDSKIIGDLNLNGNLLNISNNTNLADKQWVDNTITDAINEAIARVQTEIYGEGTFGSPNQGYGTERTTQIQYSTTYSNYQMSTVWANVKAPAISGDGNTLIHLNNSGNYWSGYYYNGNGTNESWVNFQNYSGTLDSDGSQGANNNVAISDDGRAFIVGMPYGDNWGTNVGSIEIYGRSASGSTTFSKYLTDYGYGTNSSGYHGWSVAMSPNGRYAVAGQPYGDWVGADSGSITSYYSSNGTTSWSKQGSQYAPTTYYNWAYMYYGYSVAVADDGVTFASAPYEYYPNTNYNQAGMVFVTSWNSRSNRQTIVPHSPYVNRANMYWGWKVATCGDRSYLAVLTKTENYDGIRRLMIYKNTSGYTYSLHQEIILPHTNCGEDGMRMSSDGSHILLSGSSVQLNAGVSNGQVIQPAPYGASTLLKFNTTTQKYEIITLFVGSTASDNYFGYGIDLSRDGKIVVNSQNSQSQYVWINRKT